MCPLGPGEKGTGTVYGYNPAAQASEWEKQGGGYVVDLDGAFSGVPKNREIIKEMVASLNVPVQLGRIRDFTVACGYLELGVTRIIIGTALNDSGLVESLLEEYGPELLLLELMPGTGW